MWRKKEDSSPNEYSIEDRPEYTTYDESGDRRRQIHELSDFELSFDINTENQLEELTTKTKNNILQWYEKGRVNSFQIDIIDHRVETILESIITIEEKLRREEELTSQEISEYGYKTQAITRYGVETSLKKHACETFLKDKFLQPLLSIYSCSELIDVLKSVLNFNYNEDFVKKQNSDEYMLIDVFLRPSPFERNHFVVPLNVTKIVERFGGRDIYDLCDHCVIELDLELRIDVAAYFYYFLSEELIYYKNADFLEDNRALNLGMYWIGLS